jgi:hypothetical protein
MSAAMNLLKACSVALISSALAIAVSAQDAKPTPPPTAPAPMALRLESGTLVGPAAEPLLTAIRASQFVAVGEDHGFNEIPQFMSAVWDAAHFNNLVIETGPALTLQLEQILRQSAPEKQLLAFEQKYPASVPFYNWKPEFDLLKHVVSSRPKAQHTLIGLDQEFIMSPGFLIKGILALHPSPALRTQAEAMLKANNDALASVQKTGNMGAVYMFAAPQSDFDKLAAAGKRETSADLRRLVDQLVQTRLIYAEYNANHGYASNRLRAQLMKRNLVDAIGRPRLADPPRMMFKFGAFHMFRGMNPLNSAEVGNFISELAEGLGLQSTHILILGKYGQQAAFAGLNDQAHPTDFDWTKEKNLAFAAKFYEASFSDDWSVFDLRPLRPKARDWDPAAQRLILGYDFLVIIPRGTPATNVKAD